MSDNVEIGERLKVAREAAGFKTAKQAAQSLGVSYPTYVQHENGTRGIVREADLYARRFKVSLDWLLRGRGTAPDGNMTNVNSASAKIGGIPEVEQPNAGAPKKIVAGATKIPVYGQAVGGVDGEFIMNGSLLYEVLAPPNLTETNGAYAVVVSGDSMSPRYEDGETVFVDPKRRPKRGDYVIAQIRNEENGPLLAYVKQFQRHNAHELIVSQFNPQKELRFNAENVETVHVIVGMLSGV